MINFCRKIPDHGEDQLTTASKLLEHRRQMAEADTALTSQKGVCYYFIINRLIIFKKQINLYLEVLCMLQLMLF